MAFDPCCGLIPVKTGLKVFAVFRTVMCLLCACTPAYILYMFLVVKNTEKFDLASALLATFVLITEIVNCILSVLLIVLVDRPPAKRLFIPSRISSVLSVIYMLVFVVGFFVSLLATFILTWVYVVSFFMASYAAWLVRAVVSQERRAAAAAAGPQQTWTVVSPTGGVYNYTTPAYGQQEFEEPLPPPPQTAEDPKNEAS